MGTLNPSAYVLETATRVRSTTRKFLRGGRHMLAARHPLTRILAHHLISVCTRRDGVHVGEITTPPAYGIHPFGCSGETVNSSALRVDGTQSWSMERRDQPLVTRWSTMLKAGVVRGRVVWSSTSKRQLVSEALSCPLPGTNSTTSSHRSSLTSCPSSHYTSCLH